MPLYAIRSYFVSSVAPHSTHSHGNSFITQHDSAQTSRHASCFYTCKTTSAPCYEYDPLSKQERRCVGYLHAVHYGGNYMHHLFQRTTLKYAYAFHLCVSYGSQIQQRLSPCKHQLTGFHYR